MEKVPEAHRIRARTAIHHEHVGHSGSVVRSNYCRLTGDQVSAGEQAFRVHLKLHSFPDKSSRLDQRPTCSMPLFFAQRARQTDECPLVRSASHLSITHSICSLDDSKLYFLNTILVTAPCFKTLTPILTEENSIPWHWIPKETAFRLIVSDKMR